MGTLTFIRTRANDTCSPSSPSTNYNYYTNLLKKPRVSYLSRVDRSVSRLQKYPRPVGRLLREVHAPCGYNRAGFTSCSTNMGNVFGSSGSFWSAYKAKRKAALGALRHLKIEEEEEAVVLEGSDWNEVRSNERKRKWLELGSETRDLDGEGLHSTPVYGAVYKKLLRNVDRKYSPKLKSLNLEIESYEAKLHSILSLQSLTKANKLEEIKKPQEDLLHEPFLLISEDEEGEVKEALAYSNRRRVLVTHENSNIQITGEILQCLRPGAWLNDEVINVYLELLKERERREPKKYLSCHFFNTFFYKRLIGGRNGYDYKAVRRWTALRKLGYKLSECDKIFVPIHKEVHWCLAVISKKEKTFQYLDSLGGRDSRVLTVLAKYYVDEVKDKCDQDIDVSSWEFGYSEDLPEQLNGFDCGVFMIKYADFYSRGMGLHFSQLSSLQLAHHGTR